MASVSPARYVPYGFARTHQVLVTGQTGDELEVWIGEKTPVQALAELSRTLAYRLVTVRKPEAELVAAISNAYQQQEGSAASVVDEVESDLDLSRLLQDLPKIEDLLETEDDAPIIRMINALLTQASRDGASDIHIEAFETYSVVRFRVDGTLRDVVRPRRELHAALISRIKILAQLDIAEKRLPQDGRIALRIGGRPIDVRVSTLPTGHGERAVLRLLDKEAGRLDLTRLGMAGGTLAEFDKLVHQPHGIVLVTGPTGSGKTTTLYAALQEVVRQNVNIITVEDPIEYELENVIQIQINPVIDFSFPKALRHILRHDPDVILIGEMRDYETAKIAVESALTGHLVFSTLHTNDAPSALVRLIEMGVEPYLIRSAVIGVLAQRLVRTNCTHCRVVEPVDALMRTNLDLGPEEVFWRGAGCDRCHGTGFSGRQAIYELLVMDKQLAERVEVGVSADVYRDSALASRMFSLPANGIKLARTGVVSLAEIYRACM